MPRKPPRKGPTKSARYGRSSFTIPADTLRRMRAEKDGRNWSDVAAAAIARVLDGVTYAAENERLRDEVFRLRNALERLRDEARTLWERANVGLM